MTFPTERCSRDPDRRDSVLPWVVIDKRAAAKQLAIHSLPAGGTQQQAIEPTRQDQPALTDAQVVRLAQLGVRIETHFSRPQDIEWCKVDDDFHIVMSRPIATLFPIPAIVSWTS